MVFVDEIQISASAGRGGDGVVRWLHEKGKEFGGPSGGNGGKGGDIIFCAVRDANRLSRYRGKKEFIGERGGDGKEKNKTGFDGESLIIEVPVGSLVHRKSNGESFELLQEGEKITALYGGSGGRGNASYKSSTNQYPTEFTRGTNGEQDDFKIEVKLIADAGFIGLPNAGKTSLLNALTRAEGKVGSYAFTTLDPNLGAFHGYILADIPGLIEGASQGKGLGHSFLKHVQRTKLLLHCISVEHSDPMDAYNTVRKELRTYDTSLLEKRELVILTKSDLVDDATNVRIRKVMTNEGIKVLSVSTEDKDSIRALSEYLSRVLGA